MNYEKKSFSVSAPATQEYRDNWEKTFQKEAEIRYVSACPPQCGWFDCGLCREAGYLSADGFTVIRTEGP